MLSIHYWPEALHEFSNIYLKISFEYKELGKNIAFYLLGSSKTIFNFTYRFLYMANRFNFYGGIAVIHVGFKLASDLHICKLALTLKEKWKWTIKSEGASLSWPKPTYAGCALHLCAFISSLLYHWVLYFLHCAFALSYTKLFLTFTYSINGILG
ncbi:hypothetical protein EGR_10898 [Echinococcus granulosus]|uniref:Uncharacterized protein n=1 Tax=Echinococcus granulosus TaxID=6210 RepID=W6TZS2_ECHGR|nr:hypothetical protein EGR_10898 [Echinococcus granulosus]EUB54243.1 hypothetical protein EGR_10898 [Echinococcus granulosus]